MGHDHCTSSTARHDWLMGLSNMSHGYGDAAVLVTAPQLLAARGVPEPVIANLTVLAKPRRRSRRW